MALYFQSLLGWALRCCVVRVSTRREPTFSMAAEPLFPILQQSHAIMNTTPLSKANWLGYAVVSAS